MTLTPARIVLFLFGLFLAGGIVAYGSGAFQREEAQNASTVAAVTPKQAPSATGASSTPQPAASGSQNTAQPAAPATPATGSQAEPSAPASSASSDEAGVKAPSFDLLRVEPGGSVVVAGQAAAGAEVEIVSGSTVLGKTVAGADGDFAIVLDEPLAGGDYSLVLRATNNGSAATSKETAIVSVPADVSGQVLAMVEQPGEPSRLITVPEAPAAATGSDTQQAAAQPAPGAAPGAAQPDAASGSTTAAPAEAQQATAPASPPAANGQAAAPDAPAAPESKVAAADPAPAPNSTAVAPPQAQSPAVEAVEIEAGMVYIAGRGAPGSVLRVYANDVFLGQVIATPEGRFLVEARQDLPVGDYTIRIDAIGGDGKTVVARAAVPFAREAGEAIAAVAPSSSAAPQAPAAAQSSDPAPSTERFAPADGTAAPQASAGTQPASSEAGNQSVAAAPVEATAPALKSVKGAVIIRRGDSLWKISRRAYGQGVRYSTIYLANQDQIRNPNRIYPGQIFSMPETTKDGYKVDMSQLGEQAVERD